MKVALFLFVAVLALGGCSKEKDPQVVSTSFWQYINEWSDGDEEAGEKACAFLSERALRSYSGRCLDALRSAFAPWGGKEVYRVEVLPGARWIRSSNKMIRIQPLALFVRQRKKKTVEKTVEQVEAAAVMSRSDDWKMQSLAGLAYPILLPDRDLAPSPVDMAILGST